MSVPHCGAVHTWSCGHGPGSFLRPWAKAPNLATSRRAGVALCLPAAANLHSRKRSHLREGIRSGTQVAGEGARTAALAPSPADDASPVRVVAVP